MWRGQIKYLALWLFLAGLIIIVFIQFISGENINRLNQGNKRLLNEVKIQNDLRQLEADMLTAESDVRGIVIADDTLLLNHVRHKLAKIQSELSTLSQLLDQNNLKEDVSTFTQLVQQKVQFSNTVLSTYLSQGKPAAEALINTDRGKRLRDSIVLVVAQLDSNRQNQLQLITSAIENNGNRARTWGLILGGIATLTCILAFLYMLKQGREQQLIIKKLNESEKKLKEASGLKEQFLANMSHEIRTPMNAILGFTNLLRKTKLNSQQANYLEFIRSSSDNMLALINDILDLSKIEAGMMSIENAPFSLNGLVRSVEVIFSNKAKQKGIDFNVNIDPKLHDTLSGDAVRLTQILMNLLSNAVKFTDKGYVQLDIEAVGQNANEIVIQFCVRDTGIGIAPQKKDAIFERFRQAEAETTRRYGGTGLGLSIVKQLVDLQHGNISVKSEVGKGSEFTITLPFKPVYDYTIEHSVQTTEYTGQLENVRILIAEDNLMNQQLIRHLMKQWGIDYVIVNNGEEVIQQLKTSAFSLILMDIQMPKMDGYATTLAIRNELHLPIPIVAMTAHAMAGEKENCLSYGMNEYISKPLKESKLYTIIQSYTQPVSLERNEESGIIDLAYLRELSNGDTEFEQAIIYQFIVQIPNELEALKDAIMMKDLTRIKSVAHGMKSSVAYMGLSEKVYPFLQRIESESANGAEAAHFTEDFEQVETICKQAIEDAKNLLTVNV